MRTSQRYDDQNDQIASFSTLSPSSPLSKDNSRCYEPIDSSPSFDSFHLPSALPEPLSPSTVAARRQCKECIEKDLLIEIKDSEINKLKKTLKKTQKQVWYLQTIKEKLETALSELKEKWMIDDVLLKALEVCMKRHIK